MLPLPDSFYRAALNQAYAEHDEDFRYYVALIPPKGPGNFMVVPQRLTRRDKLMCRTC